MKNDTPENFFSISTFLGKTVITKRIMTASQGRKGTS